MEEARNSGAGGGSKGQRAVQEGSLVHSSMLTNVEEEEDGTRTLDLGTDFGRRGGKRVGLQ